MCHIDKLPQESFTRSLNRDGAAVAYWHKESDHGIIPAGMVFRHTSRCRLFSHRLLKSDGKDVACGHNVACQCDIPALIRAVPYNKLLRDDFSQIR